MLKVALLATLIIQKKAHPTGVRQIHTVLKIISEVVISGKKNSPIESRFPISKLGFPWVAQTS
jgi:hypothetical protein